MFICLKNKFIFYFQTILQQAQTVLEAIFSSINIGQVTMTRKSKDRDNLIITVVLKFCIYNREYRSGELEKREKETDR